MYENFMLVCLNCTQKILYSRFKFVYFTLVIGAVHDNDKVRKKVLSSHPGQVDFLTGQVTFEARV